MANFFLKTVHWNSLKFLKYNYLFMRPQNLKTSLKIYPKLFLRGKISTFAVFK